MPDYIPRADADFDTWLANFMAGLSGRLSALGVTAGEFTALQTTREEWNGALSAHNETQSAAATATQTKNQRRENFEKTLRALVRRVQEHPNMQDSDRIALGITARVTTRTPSPTPTTRPVAQVDMSQRLRHTITFADETTPNSRAKPDGVRGCEIWSKVGDAPASLSELSFLALDTASPYVIDYQMADAGQPAHYMLRWANSRGEQGPWSQTVSATIPA